MDVDFRNDKDEDLRSQERKRSSRREFPENRTVVIHDIKVKNGLLTFL